MSRQSCWPGCLWRQAFLVHVSFPSSGIFPIIGDLNSLEREWSSTTPTAESLKNGSLRCRDSDHSLTTSSLSGRQCHTPHCAPSHDVRCNGPWLRMQSNIIMHRLELAWWSRDLYSERGEINAWAINALVVIGVTWIPDSADCWNDITDTSWRSAKILTTSTMVGRRLTGSKMCLVVGIFRGEV